MISRSEKVVGSCPDRFHSSSSQPEDHFERISVKPTDSMSPRALIFLALLHGLWTSFGGASTSRLPQSIKSSVSWSPEYSGATLAPGAQNSIHPNHAYPDNASSNLLTGTLSQDTLFDDVRDSSGSKSSETMHDRKWSSLGHDPQNSMDNHESGRHSANSTYWIPRSDQIPQPEAFLPTPIYFSFSDRVTIKPRAQHTPNKPNARSSETDLVWLDSTPDPGELGVDAHRMGSRHLAADMMLPPISLQFPRNIQLERRSNSQQAHNKNAPWFKVLTSRIGRSPPTGSADNKASERQINQRATKVVFDEPANQQLDYDGASSSIGNGKHDNLGSYAALPLFYDTLGQSIEGRSSKFSSISDEDRFSDSIASASRYSGLSSHFHPMPQHYYAALPAPYPISYKNPALNSRKGVEKSILLGVGSALISFLILSNIFLSLPLLAITLMHLFTGANLFSPFNNNNNNNQPPNNNNNITPQPTANGRRKRDLRDEMIAEQVIDAINRFAAKF